MDEIIDYWRKTASVLDADFSVIDVLIDDKRKVTITITERDEPRNSIDGVLFKHSFISREDWERENVKPCTDGFMKFQVSQ